MLQVANNGLNYFSYLASSIANYCVYPRDESRNHKDTEQGYHWKLFTGNASKPKLCMQYSFFNFILERLPFIYAVMHMGSSKYYKPI